MVRPNLHQVLNMDPNNNYNEILANFEQFCDQFELGAAKRFSGQDNDSRQPIDNAEVQRVTPTVVREIGGNGTEDLIIGETPIDVPSTSITESSEYS